MFSLRYFTTVLACQLVAISFAKADDSISLPGTWKATGELPDGGTKESTFTITNEADAFQGTAIDDSGEERKIDRVKIEGNKVILEVDIKSDEEAGIVRVVAEQSAPGKLTGTWSLIDSKREERTKAPWNAVRISEPSESAPMTSLAGKWNAKATLGDGRELPSVVTFTESDNQITGQSTSENGETVFDSVKRDGKTVNIEMTLDLNGNELDVRIETALKDDDHLEGKWVIFDDSGQQAATGAWSAKRIPTLDLTGTWNVTATTDDGENEHKAIFERMDAGYTGRVEGDFGRQDYTTVEVTGNDVHLAIPFGEGTIKIIATAPEHDKLDGKWTFFDASGTKTASNDFAAVREKADTPGPTVTGEWSLTIKLGENNAVCGLTIGEKDGESLKGILVSPSSGEHELDSVTFENDQLVMIMTKNIQGAEIEFVYRGKLTEQGALSGSIVPKGYEDHFNGEWTAQRKD